jgi:Mg2+/citrate symporter
VRYWLPLVAALACLIVANQVSAIVGFILIVLAFGLVIDVSTKLFENAGKTGGLHDHRQ